jgi:hypothetical protein
MINFKSCTSVRLEANKVYRRLVRKWFEVRFEVVESRKSFGEVAARGFLWEEWMFMEIDE